MSSSILNFKKNLVQLHSKHQGFHTAEFVGFDGQRTDIKQNIEIKNENLLKVLTHAKGSYSSISTTISHIWIVNLHFGVTATALAHVIVSFQICSSKIDQGRTVRVRASDFRRMK